MKAETKELVYIPSKIDKFIEKIELVDSEHWKTVDLFFIKDIKIYPKRPIKINFSYNKPLLSLTKFKGASLRLNEFLKKLGICQYCPNIISTFEYTYIFLVNCSSKILSFKEGENIGKAQIYLNNYDLNNSLIKYFNYSYTSIESSDSEKSLKEESISVGQKNLNFRSIVENSNKIPNIKNDFDFFENNNSEYFIHNNDIISIFDSDNISPISKFLKGNNSNSNFDYIAFKDNEIQKNNANDVKDFTNSIKNNSKILLSKKKRRKLKGINKKSTIKQKNKKKIIRELKDDDILDFDFEENYLKTFKRNQPINQKKELKNDLITLSQKYSKKSEIEYAKLTKLEKNLYTKKGKPKNKITAKNIENELKELILLKKEENRFMKDSLTKIWKKIDIL